MTPVVLDTNVLVSGLLVPGSPPARILQQFRNGKWSLVVSPAIIEEYGRVLRRRRFGFSLEKVESVLAEIQSRAWVVIPSQRFDAIPQDPPDNEFLDVAFEAKAGYLISGDSHLLDLGSFRGTSILSPARFLALH